MTLGKTLTIISLALISTVLTACGEGAGIKIECSRPQDAFNASCLDANDPNSVDNRLTQCLDNENAHSICARLIDVDTGDISGYDALPATLATLPAGDTTGFVKITGSEITTTGLGANGETITSVTQTLTGNDDDGYAYAVGTNGAIAGILPTTDLGAPVFARTGTANWTGTYSLSDLATNRTISFAINFGTRKMTGTATTSAGVALTTNTDFNEYGAITGTFSVNTQNADNTANPITGSVMGLIGREGTVGVFHGANNPAVGASANFHAGGFIAAPTP